MQPSVLYLSIVLAALLPVICTSCNPPQETRNVQEDVGTKDRPVNVPDNILSALTGSLAPIDGTSDTASALSGSIYNGSEWIIIDMDIIFKKIKVNEERKFRLRFVEKKRTENYKLGDPYYSYIDAPLNPFSSGDAYVTSGRFSDGLQKNDFEWAPISARGYKP